MEYKGYYAKVEYDDSAGMLHGEVINVAPYPIVTFQASNVDDLKREFHTSIDDYLRWCAEDGAEPRRGFSGKLSLRLGPDLHRQVSVEAAALDLSINEWITRTISKEIEANSEFVQV